MGTRDLSTTFPGGDRFELVGELGRGGMGVVYEVRDRDQGTRLALKGLRRVGPRAILRLKHEFRAVRDLAHPNLVRLHELFEHDGAWCFTMELVDGVDFLRWVRPGDPRPRARRPPSSDGTAATVADGLAARVVPAAVTETSHETGPRAPAGPQPRGRGWAGVDEARLRAALRGLIAGVAAIHRAGMVHRDVKPSNVLVEPDGRVVLLDFGVVADVSGNAGASGEIVGTYAYMAPEQAAAAELGPPADWYAVGTMLFEALTGELPYPSELGVEAKITVDAPSPRARASGLPDDLVELCERLLRRDPAARPGDGELLARFRIDEADAGPTFIGRAAELDALRAAFDAARATGAARAVVVAGESGIGKSALCRRFLDELAAVRTDVLVLAGRCDDRELVSYNALDRAVDGLARFLAGLPPEEVAAPGGTAELLQIFPVLRTVPSLDAATRHDPRASLAGAIDVRSLAFAALADLLAAAAARQPIVLLVEDVHWADGDSLALLGELFAGADAPPVLLVATARAEPDEAPAITPVLRVPTEVLRLGGLARGEAEALVRATAPGADAARLAADTGGHPMFLAELARQSAAGGDASAVRLDDALWRRIAGLDRDARALLDLVALAAAPLPLGLVPGAAGLTTAASASALAALRTARLVRVSGSRDHDRIEPYHHRVRETVGAHLAADRRRAIHRALAEHLERAGGVEVLAYHLAQAGEGPRAAALAEAAARRAFDALAFDRAAEWLRLALELGTPSPARRRLLVAERADALARAGHTATAADAFLAAAEGEPADVARELRRRATEQLLIGGHLARGRALAATVAVDAGLGLAASTAGAIVRLAWYQARLGLSRLRWTPRPVADVAPVDRMRNDVAWTLSAGLAMVDSTRGASLAMRMPLLALPTADPARIARAACAASFAASGMGRRRLALRLRDLSRAAAAATDDPAATVYATFAEIAFCFYQENDWPGALAASERAAAAIPDRHSHTFEADIIEQHHVWTLYVMGELAELRRRVPPTIRSAQRTGNRFVEISHRTFFPLLHLAIDRADQARADLQDALATWHGEVAGVTNPFFFALKGRSLTVLYEGDPDGDPTLEADWARLDASLLAHIPMIRAESASFLGALAVARAARARARGARAELARQLAIARRCARRARKVGLPAGRQMGDVIAAGAAFVAGDVEAARARLHALVGFLDGSAQRLTAAACRWRLAQLVGGDQGAALHAEALRYFASQHVARPDRLVAALVPGW